MVLCFSIFLSLPLPLKLLLHNKRDEALCLCCFSNYCSVIFSNFCVRKTYRTATHTSWPSSPLLITAECERRKSNATQSILGKKSNCRVRLTRLFACLWVMLTLSTCYGQLCLCNNCRGRDMSHGLQVHVS